MFSSNYRDDEDATPGYSRQRLYRYYPDEEISNVDLLLPQNSKLVAHAKGSRERAENEQTEFNRAKLDALEKARPKSETSTTRSGWPSQKAPEPDASEEREILRERMEADAQALSGTNVEVYAWDEPMRLIENVRTVDRETIARNKKLFARLKDKGNRRPLTVHDTNCENGLADLLAEHPHFEEVIMFARDQLKLSARLDKATRIPPILLLGPPGIGKTHFSNSLAKTLGTAIHRLGFDAALTSSTLLGSDRNWGNSTSGLLFDAVCLGENANPVILLDEIDKARSGEGYQHPLASLHSLLEPVSADNVRDISLDYAFDASHVVWIAAANDPTAIPATLRSRFTEFRVEAPTGAAALQLAQGVLRRTHASTAIQGFKEPEYAFVRLLAHLTAREMRQALERAYATAIANGRNHLLRNDLPADVLMDEPDSGSKPTTWLH